MAVSFLFAFSLAWPLAYVEAEAVGQSLHMETMVQSTDEWRQERRAAAEDKLELVFAVRQLGAHKLEEALLEVSDPRSEKYGQHLSNDQVHELVAPDPKSIRAVMSFLNGHGVVGKAATPNADMITATVSFATAERMLTAEYFRYRHTATGHVAHRASNYSLPMTLKSHVDFVAPTVRLPSVRPLPPDSPDQVDASSLNTPSVLRKLYSVGDEVGKAPKNRQAVTGFLEQYFSAADLQEFYALFFRQGKGQMIAPKGDAATGGAAGTEAMLDAEYITALGAHIATEFWGFSGRAPDSPENEPFLKWLQVVSNTPDDKVPLVFSTSYGEDEDSVSMAYASRINVEFMKAGARGISLLFASGDSGAAGDQHTCKGGKFVPQWPAASPYVTAVGGTQGGGLAPPETAAAISSGGFSNRWARPAWQEDAVQGYLKMQGLPDKQKFNASGRGFPDISAQAMSFVIVANRLPLPGVSGTSCASPTAAGVVGLLNDARLQAGKAPMGFLNPFIYQHAGAFNDCTSGRNMGCFLSGGFPAVKGWDAVTGVGTPNYAQLKAEALGEVPMVV